MEHEISMADAAQIQNLGMLLDLFTNTTDYPSNSQNFKEEWPEQMETEWMHDNTLNHWSQNHFETFDNFFEAEMQAIETELTDAHESNNDAEEGTSVTIKGCRVKENSKMKHGNSFYHNLAVNASIPPQIFHPTTDDLLNHATFPQSTFNPAEEIGVDRLKLLRPNTVHRKAKAVALDDIGSDSEIKASRERRYRLAKRVTFNQLVFRIAQLKTENQLIMDQLNT